MASVSRELYSVIKNDKKKELPKLNKKSVSNNFNLTLRDMGKIGKMFREMEQERGKPVSRLEKLAFYAGAFYMGGH